MCGLTNCVINEGCQSYSLRKYTEQVNSLNEGICFIKRQGLSIIKYQAAADENFFRTISNGWAIQSGGQCTTALKPKQVNPLHPFKAFFFSVKRLYLEYLMVLVCVRKIQTVRQLRNIICTLYSIPLPPIQTETYSIKAPFYYCDLEVMAVQCYYIYSLQYVVVIKAYNVPVFLCLVPTTTNNQVFTRYDKLNIFICIIFGQIVG